MHNGATKEQLQRNNCIGNCQVWKEGRHMLGMQGANKRPVKGDQSDNVLLLVAPGCDAHW